MRYVLILLAAVLIACGLYVASAGADAESDADLLAPPRSTCNSFQFGSADNYFLGNEGACEIVRGGGGADELYGDSAAPGGKGDYLYGEGGHGDIVAGGGGNDLVTGGPGRDGLHGNEGDDIIGADDGWRDNINCGSGHDIVYRDTLSVEGRVRNCEVHRVNGG